MRPTSSDGRRRFRADLVSLGVAAGGLLLACALLLWGTVPAGPPAAAVVPAPPPVLDVGANVADGRDPAEPEAAGPPRLVGAAEPPLVPDVEPAVHTEPEAAPELPDPFSPPLSVRRVAVAGAPGYSVELLPDGSSRLALPDGSVRPLAGPPPPAAAVPAQPPARRPPPAPRPEDLQLYVLENGIVSIPKSAVVTAVEADRVITHDGSTTRVYHSSGRIETTSLTGNDHDD